MCDADELSKMWNDWCWNYEIGVPCTLEKGHEGSHAWDADRWDIYMRAYHASRIPDSEFEGRPSHSVRVGGGTGQECGPSVTANRRSSIIGETDLTERILRAAQLARPIYVAHNWKWGIPGEKYDVPTVEEIANVIHVLYQDALDSESGLCSTGRMTVSVDGDDGSVVVEVQLADLRDVVPEFIGQTENA